MAGGHSAGGAAPVAAGARQKLPRQRGEGILIAGGLRLPTAVQFRSEISARNAFALRRAGRHRDVAVRSQAKVRHAPHAIVIHPDVRGLDVAVNDAVAMGDIKPFGNLLQNGDKLFQRAGPVGTRGHPRSNILPRRVSANDVNLVTDIHQLLDGGQARMQRIRHPADGLMNAGHDLLGAPHGRRQPA